MQREIQWRRSQLCFYLPFQCLVLAGRRNVLDDVRIEKRIELGIRIDVIVRLEGVIQCIEIEILELHIDGGIAFHIADVAIAILKRNGAICRLVAVRGIADERDRRRWREGLFLHTGRERYCCKGQSPEYVFKMLHRD